MLQVVRQLFDTNGDRSANGDQLGCLTAEESVGPIDKDAADKPGSRWARRLSTKASKLAGRR